MNRGLMPEETTIPAWDGGKEMTFIKTSDEELLNSIRFYHSWRIFIRSWLKCAEISSVQRSSMIAKAYQVASRAYEGQVRKLANRISSIRSCVGIILADLELDKETITAGLLHDVA